MTARVLAAVWVPGVPRTQGSMKSVGGGNMAHSPALVAWRSLVRQEVVRYTSSVTPHEGPVAVRCIFVRGDGVGDIDKLARAVLDALTESRVIADDVQVVELRCSRVNAVAGRNDGVFVLVATTSEDDPIEVRYGAEIEGWVGR